VGVNIYLTIDIQFNQITEVKAELSDLNETIMIQKAEIEELKSNILEVNEIHLGNNSNSKTIIYKDENGTMVTGFT
jgi:cell division protein FtsL